MSWAGDEWKDGLPSRALQKIQQLETSLDKVKKEQKQKQFQLESLDQAYQKQLRKVEEEKSQNSILKRESQSLMDTCREIEEKKEKVMHELQTKDSLIACLEGKITHTKSQLETETTRNHQLKGEVEKAEAEHLQSQKKLERLSHEHSQLQENCNHQKRQLESQAEKVRNLQYELKKLESGLDRQGNRSRHISTSSHVDHSGDDVTSLKNQLKELQEKYKNEVEAHERVAANLQLLQDKVDQELNAKSTEMTSLREEKMNLSLKLENRTLAAGAKSREQQIESLEQQKINDIALQKMESTLQDLKKENESIKASSSKLELQLQAKEKEVANLNGKIAEMQTSLDSNKSVLADKDKVVNKLQAELNKVTADLEKANIKLTGLEQKNKQLTQELDCQRHNAEAARQAQEQRMKEREQELRAEIAQHSQVMTALDKQYNDMKKTMQQELNQARK
ncbi:centromere protein F-like [Ptychodera flava]|uniref:centromere protein F-like n=1 Tax=Ptychodera flava TaxID=63121 RepID=UPI00396A082D